MRTIRRTYIYLVCAICLQAVAWAVITLLDSLLVRSRYTSLESTALQIAVVIIGLPVFLGHWLWAQRLAKRETDEREALVRRLYLYGSMAAFLAPAVNNTFALLETLLELAFGVTPASSAQTIVHAIVAIVVLALLWLYHRWVLLSDVRSAPETGSAATVRRLYIYGFSAAGLAMTTLAIVSLVRWVMFQFGDQVIARSQMHLASEVARLAVGLALWLIFWSRAQRLSARSEEEQGAVLRWLYIYLAVFIAVIGSVTAATAILAGLFRRVLGVSSPDGGDIREGLSIILGLGLVWAYHAYVLRQDADRATERPAQLKVRRLYLYVVAHVGLGALLIGLSGDISVLIRWLSGVRFGSGLGEEVAWFTAMIVAGLPVWILPWRQVQNAALAPGPAGDEERRSLVRKLYLYFYLFLATVTVLSAGVYIVSQLVGLILGARGSAGFGSELGRAIAFSLIAVGVWLYHGSILRGDSRQLKQAELQRLETIRVTVMDAGDGSLGRALVDRLAREVPGVNVQALGLTRAAAEALGTDADQVDADGLLATSDLIVGPWTIAVAGAAGGAIRPLIARAVAASQARKIIAPVSEEGWDWAGIGSPSTKDITRDAIQAVNQIGAGQEVKLTRRLGAGAVAGIVVGAIFMLLFFGLPLIFLFAEFVY